jgi:hypothetical protein
VRDFADMKGDGTITKPLADKALAMLDVDLHGLDVMDRKLLEAVIHRFDGGPVGLDNVAAAIGEERDTIEDVIEPFLIQQGFLQRTPRGRVRDARPPTGTRRRAAEAARAALFAERLDQVFVGEPVVAHRARRLKRLATSTTRCTARRRAHRRSASRRLARRATVAAHQVIS